VAEEARRELAERLVAELVAIGRGACGITDATIEAERDETVREILAALLMLHEDLAWQKEERTRADEARRQLMAFVLHDLNNQIAAAISNSYYLAELAGLTGEARDAGRELRDAMRTMGRMVANLREIADAEEGRLRPSLAVVELTPLIEEVRSQHVARAADIAVAVAPAVRAVRTDASMLRRVLENLVDGAVAVSSDGEAVRVEADPQDGGASFELSVSDLGPAIATEHREILFDRRGRLAPHDAVKRRSRGLGLAYCRLATEALGGRIWVEDNRPKGCVFRLRLPRAL
jgi:K+-sensing histidine kinase KdpD